VSQIIKDRGEGKRRVSSKYKKTQVARLLSVRIRRKHPHLHFNNTRCGNSDHQVLSQT